MKSKLFLATLAATTFIPAVVAQAAQGPFDDVPANHPYAKEIGAMKEAGIITGNANQFKPSQAVSREHAVLMLSRALPLAPIREGKTFLDVPATSTYADVIAKAYRAGVIDGAGDNFKPKQVITRAQMAKMLVQAFHLQPRTDKGDFTDVAKDHWAKDYINILASHGITTGDNGKFKPNEPVTRAHMAVFLQRAMAQQTTRADFVGQWEGTLAEAMLAMQVNITPDSAMISIPAQGIKDYPVALEMKGEVAVMTVTLGNQVMTLESTLTDGLMTTVFKQNNQMFNMVFHPVEPEVITYEKVTVPVEGGNLQAALQLPVNVSKPVPVAIIIAGSGPTDKDGNSAIAGKNNSLKMVAEGLADKGIATLRYDKRGVGSNTALLTTEEGLVVEDYAKDVEALIEALNKDARFNEVHLIGHSEGAFMASLAAQHKQVASITSLAGAGRPIGEVLLEQLEAQSPAITNEAKAILAKLEQGEHVTDISPALQSLFRPSIQDYMISWLAYDPATLLQQTKAKTLIVQGENDLQVKPADAKRLSEFTASKAVYFKEMNHVLKDAPTDPAGNMATYFNPTLPLTEALVPTIATFIKS
ncbi:MAG TPA: alpha/beta fold hydrolase [Metalysinibacillus sp.]